MAESRLAESSKHCSSNIGFDQGYRSQGMGMDEWLSNPHLNKFRNGSVSWRSVLNGSLAHLMVRNQVASTRTVSSTL